MRETPFVKQIRGVLEVAGAFVVKTHGGPIVSGLPDLVICYQGAYIVMEVKRPDRPRKGTALQEYTLGQVRDAGGWAGVVNDIQQVHDLLLAWPFVCRYCLGRLVPLEGGGLWCHACGNNGGHNVYRGDE